MVLSDEDTAIIARLVTATVSQTVDSVMRANKERDKTERDKDGEWTRKEILDAKKMSMV